MAAAPSTLRLVPPRPAGTVLCPTCADTGQYPWVHLVDGVCPFNARRDKGGKVRQGGTCRKCWGHVSDARHTLCGTCFATRQAQHGVSGYRLGCRCLVCRAAQRDKQREWRGRRAA